MKQHYLPLIILFFFLHVIDYLEEILQIYNQRFSLRKE